VLQQNTNIQDGVRETKKTQKNCNAFVWPIRALLKPWVTETLGYWASEKRNKYQQRHHEKQNADRHSDPFSVWGLIT